MAAHCESKVCGQSGSIVLRFPGSGTVVSCRHSQIFVAAQVWHGMLQELVQGHSCEQLAWQVTAGACFIWVAGVAGAADMSCIHGAGAGDAGCAAKKWHLAGV